MRTKHLNPALVTYTIEAEYDDTPVRGNALASGSDEEDRQAEDDILARLDNGDVWAWARVTVTAHYPNLTLTGTDTLGACNYTDEADFKVGGYYEDMCAEALRDLQRQVSAVFAAVG